MIVGTAGHIDHGKTTLVRALTGVDTDRLPEEKRRGITIDLGFAPLALPGIGTVGVVDVPGHEAFVRTMLAGAAGIDAGLLVVAADDGVQPQTREHLAILELLGVRGGVVALTKCDLADAEWTDLVEEDVRALAAGTAFANAPVVRTRPGDVAALEALRIALARALANAGARASDEPFRLPIDRVFTIRGTGTVVTGTAWSGAIEVEEEALILPAGKRARVRSLQVHGADTTRAEAGQRTAVALVGLDVADLHRGDVLVTHAGWSTTMVLRADVAMLPELARVPGPRTRVRLHLGTAEVGARIVVQGGAFEAGSTRPARVVLDAPILARAGDRFVLRAPSPAETIGGGVVTDAIASRRAKPFPAAGQSLADRVRLVLGEAGPRGGAPSALRLRLAARSSDLDSALAEAGAVAIPGADLAVTSAALADAMRRLGELLSEYHRRHPLAEGAPLQELRARLNLSGPVFEFITRRAVECGKVEMTGGLGRLVGWKPTLSNADEDNLQQIFSRLSESGREPPDARELAAFTGRDPMPILRVAESRSLVVQVESDRYYTTDNLNEIIEAMSAAFPTGSELSPTQVRELLGVSRKYVIPLLEYLDRVGITARRADTRVWKGRGGVA